MLDLGRCSRAPLCRLPASVAVAPGSGDDPDATLSMPFRSNPAVPGDGGGAGVLEVWWCWDSWLRASGA